MVIAVGKTLVVGDDDWGVVPAEVMEYDEDSGALMLKLLDELQPETSASLTESG